MSKFGSWAIVLWLIFILSSSFYLAYIDYAVQHESNASPWHKPTEAELVVNSIFLALMAIPISGIPFSFLYGIITKSRPTIWVFLIVNATVFFACICGFIITSILPVSWQESFSAAILLYSISLLLVSNLYYFARLFSPKN